MTATPTPAVKGFTSTDYGAEFQRLTTRQLMIDHNISRGSAWLVLRRLVSRYWAYDTERKGVRAAPYRDWPSQGTSMAVVPASRVPKSRRPKPGKGPKPGQGNEVAEPGNAPPPVSLTVTTTESTEVADGSRADHGNAARAA
ncbi:hypothetical protein Aple_044770 [Acrocarpospora pleiomorpha]|uniref:Uncharacterized protein n=1 Tax=Acrocarpospora pleiomorpha TaxID=90975 RepID=A0A5M3XPK5_9ACTN|nr:hypothetical protein Aple_044770 [Acrocarpospora pleiomorpha]